MYGRVCSFEDHLSFGDSVEYVTGDRVVCDDF